MSHALALRWLESHRTVAGAWAYRADGPEAAEPTLLAVAAGASVPTAWLLDADLGWSELLLPTVLSAETTARSGRASALEALGTRAVETILSRRGQPAEPAGDYDGELIGWTWVDGTFSWVQPTTWALLSLRHVGQGAHPRATEGYRLLADRQGADGGWNYGNPHVLGKDLPGYLYLTGWALLALPRTGEPGALDPTDLGRGFTFLEGVRQTPSTTNLALAVLARLAHDRDPSREIELLRDRQQADGSFGEATERTALAACALRAVEMGTCPLLGHRWQAPTPGSEPTP